MPSRQVWPQQNLGTSESFQCHRFLWEWKHKEKCVFISTIPAARTCTWPRGLSVVLKQNWLLCCFPARVASCPGSNMAAWNKSQTSSGALSPDEVWRRSVRVAVVLIRCYLALFIKSHYSKAIPKNIQNFQVLTMFTKLWNGGLIGHSRSQNNTHILTLPGNKQSLKEDMLVLKVLRKTSWLHYSKWLCEYGPVTPHNAPIT